LIIKAFKLSRKLFLNENQDTAKTKQLYKKTETPIEDKCKKQST